MFRRWSDWVTRRRHSVQYEVQRMTHQGGWQNYYQTNYESPPSRPVSDNDIQILGDEEGYFRCIRRKGSHIDTVIWEYETARAEKTYTSRRRQAVQREQLFQMDREEIHAEIENRSELTDLPWRELFEAYFDRHEKLKDEETNLKSIETQLVQTVADQEGAQVALREYRELLSSERQGQTNYNR